MKIALSIALGGSLGALARYYLSQLIERLAPPPFPLWTLAVNLLGSLVIGFCFGLFDRLAAPAEVKNFLTVGFIGAFTTFSTFALENINLFRGGEIKLGLLNIVASNAGGLLCVLAGVMVAEMIFKKA